MTRHERTQFGSQVKSGRPRTAAKGRVCEAPGCTTVLSMYNELAMCGAHERPRVRPPLYRP